MLISFNCPHCDSELEVDAAEAGTRFDCPACSQECRTPVPRVGPGTTLGNFAIERKLGSGGMGDVFIARQLSMDRLVALKVLPQALTRKPTIVERFRHEVRMSARLEHPHVVTAFEAGEDFGYLYLAMSYVDGEDLRTRLKRDGPLPEKEGLTYGRQIADALGYAWTTFRMLHRDVKPGNILVDRKGNARIMDLGISKCLAENEDAELTVSGMLVGTPHYMSPEQATSGGELDCRADIYSLGATLYHVLTGATPYQGQTAAEVLRQVGVIPVPPLRELNSIISEPCAKLVAKMMSLNRDHRQASWDAVVTDIDRVLVGREPLLVVGEHAVEEPARAPAAAVDAGTPRAGAGTPARVPPVVAPPAREPQVAGRSGMAADSAEFRTPPKIDLRRRQGQRLLRRLLWQAGGALAAVGLCLAVYYGCRSAVRNFDVPQRARNLLAGRTRVGTPRTAPGAGSASQPDSGLTAPVGPAAPGPGSPSPPPTLEPAAERRLAAVLKQAADEALASRPENAAAVLDRAARESALEPLSAELFRAAAVVGEGQRERALLRESLTAEVGQAVTLVLRSGTTRLKLLRLEEDVVVGLRLLAGDDTPGGQVRVSLADLAEEEVISRLRRHAGKPGGDAVLALALLRAGRSQEATEPISRLPVLLQEALRPRLPAEGPSASAGAAPPP